ncbi:MAG: hypothetical protein RIR51_2184 [Bacteroidota bacterium]|jgi:hypothetical protein
MPIPFSSLILGKAISKLGVKKANFDLLNSSKNGGKLIFGLLITLNSIGISNFEEFCQVSTLKNRFF